MRVCHTITINQDENCENNPNEDFFSNLALASGMQPITVIRERARVIIDDNMDDSTKLYLSLALSRSVNCKLIANSDADYRKNGGS